MLQSTHEHAAHIETLTGDTFDARVLHGDGRIAVEFMSYGCSHCRAIEPIIQKVAETLAAFETIYRVNVAVDQELAQTYAVAGTPTLIMFRDAREVGRVEGPHPTIASVTTAVTKPFES